jgi:hypothetical protein
MFTLSCMFLTIYFFYGDLFFTSNTTGDIESFKAVRDTLTANKAIDSLLSYYQINLRKEDSVRGNVFSSVHIRKDTTLMKVIRGNEKLVIHSKSK